MEVMRGVCFICFVLGPVDRRTMIILQRITSLTYLGTSFDIPLEPFTKKRSAH